MVEPGSPHETVPIFRDIDDYKGQHAKIEFKDSIRFATFDDYHGEDPTEYADRYQHYATIHPNTDLAIEPNGYVVTEKDFSLASLSHGIIGLLYEAATREQSGSFLGYAPAGIILSGGVVKLSSFDEMHAPQKISKDLLQSTYESNSVPIQGWIHFHTETENFTVKNTDFTNVGANPCFVRVSSVAKCFRHSLTSPFPARTPHRGRCGSEFPRRDVS